MAGATSGHRSEYAARRRHQAARRKKYLRRRITIGILLLAVIGLGYFGTRWLMSRWPDKSPAEESTAAQLAFTPEVLMPVDFDGDTKTDAQVAVGPAKDAQRSIALVTGTKAPFKQIGTVYQVLAARLEIRDLPRAKGALVLSGTLPNTGEPKQVDVPGGGKATEAAGGEPFFQAWRLDKEKGLISDDFYALSAPDKPTADIVVDKYLNALWLYKDGKLAATYRVATGKYLDAPPPSAVNQAQNYVTPLGKYTITNLQTNPTYNKLGIKGGDPKNPLGTRFLGFSVYSGDGAGVWAIHGTDEPENIGKWISDGCIRLKNQDVEKLFEQVKSGTTLEIVSSRPAR